MFCLVNSLLLILLLSHFSIVAVSRWTFWFLKDSSETYGLWPAQLLCAKSPPSWAQQRSSSCHCYNGGWSPGAISLFANDLSTVISGIYCGIRAAALLLLLKTNSNRLFLSSAAPSKIVIYVRYLKLFSQSLPPTSFVSTTKTASKTTWKIVTYFYWTFKGSELWRNFL